MESFIDEYQNVRIFLGVGGLALLAAYAFLGYREQRVLPIALALMVVAVHALWCRSQRVRAPMAMLGLDLSLWGALMLAGTDTPEVNVATLAFLVVLAVLFSDGYWMVGFIAYVVGWYTVAFFMTRPVDVDTTGVYMAVMFTVGGLIAITVRIKGWLERLDANRSQMLGTVSHELRNGLTGILGLADLVTSADLPVDEVGELMGLVRNQAVDSTEILEDLLTVSRIERSALTVHLESVDVVAEINTTARRFAGEGVDVAVAFADELPPVSADPLRLRQILRNLISNAVRYGGPHLEVEAIPAGDSIQITVSDDGDGVPVGDVTTIFLPYRRSTASRRNPSSVGLGLWICRQLAHAMGGSLEYRRLDGSTQFVLTLRSHTAEAEGLRKPGRAMALVTNRDGTMSQATATR